MNIDKMRFDFYNIYIKYFRQAKISGGILRFCRRLAALIFANTKKQGKTNDLVKGRNVI